MAGTLDAVGLLDDPARFVGADDLLDECDGNPDGRHSADGRAAVGLGPALGPWQRLARAVPLEEDAHDPSALGWVPDDVLLARLAHAEALTTQLAAAQARVLTELRCRRLAGQAAAHGHDVRDCPQSACCDPDGWLALEASLAMGLSERQVGSRLATAERLERYRATAAAMRAGLVQAWTGTVLLEHLDVLSAYLSPEQVDSAESAALAWLLDRPRTVAQLGARMRRLLVAARAAAAAGDPGRDPDAPHDALPDGAVPPDSPPDEPRRPEDERQVSLGPARVLGLTELVALLPEADALTLHATLTALAHERSDADDSRSAAQRRADLLVALVAGVPAQRGRPGDLDHALRADGAVQVHLDVTVPVTSLLPGSVATGAGTGVAEVPGYGPVPGATACALADRGGTARPLVIDPGTGYLLGFGARPVPLTWLAALPDGRGYQHPPTVETALRLRDGTCRAPGCARRAARCDCDHVVPYRRGRTTLPNGCCLCRRHHRLKTHAPGWEVVPGEDGELAWTTPTGATTSTTPHDYR